MYFNSTAINSQSTINNNQLEKFILERQLLAKCSQQSKMQITITEKPAKNSTKKNIKKLRQVISNKLKKIINLRQPGQFDLRSDSVNSSSSIKLVNFNYKSNFVSNTSVSMKKSQLMDITPIVDLQNKYRISDVEQDCNDLEYHLSMRMKRQCSDGELSSGSSCGSSLSFSSSTDEAASGLFKSNQITHLFSGKSELQQQQNLSEDLCVSDYLLFNQSEMPVASQAENINFSSNFVETSTPVINRQKSSIMSQFIEPNPVSLCLIDEQDECEDSLLEDKNNIAQFMDQSTQAPVDSPVLIESTFDTSSLSNLSDDLIILQTATVNHCTPHACSSPSNSRFLQNSKKSFRKPTIQQRTPLAETTDKSNWNLFVINKYHNDTNASFKNVPNWAQGTELNLAIVNQLYFNPNGMGIFNGKN